MSVTCEKKEYCTHKIKWILSHKDLTYQELCLSGELPREALGDSKDGFHGPISRVKVEECDL